MGKCKGRRKFELLLNGEVEGKKESCGVIECGSGREQGNVRCY